MNVINSPRYLLKRRINIMMKLCVSILILLRLFLFNIVTAEVMAKDPYPDIYIPIYPGAKEVRDFYDISACIKSKSYRVELEYPATEIIVFYNEKFKSLGFNKFTNRAVTKEEWITFQDGTRKGKPFVRQFSTSWVNQERDIKVLLVLRYETTIPKKWDNKLLVVCQIMPFIEDKDLNEFFKKLEKEGKFENFINLLKKYSTSAHDIDFERAIRENPDNQYLMEYYKILKKSLRTTKQKFCDTQSKKE